MYTCLTVQVYIWQYEHTSKLSYVVGALVGETYCYMYMTVWFHNHTLPL